MELTRKELYELVWSEPIKNVAPRFAISDVALSKICRKHDIPRPPRGYWAKLTAGKPVTQVPLPKRRLGMPRAIDLNRRHQWHSALPDDPATIEIPPTLEFSEPLENLVGRVRKMVGKVTVPRDLSQAHHQVRKLLDRDDERREAQHKQKHHSSFDNLLFDSPFERRRLRLLNAIFIGLGRNGVRTSIRGKDPDQFEFAVGEQNLSFTLDHPGIRRYGSRWGDEAERPSSLSMHLEIKSWRSLDGLQLIWKDEPGEKLERQLCGVVVTMIVAGELQYRFGEIAKREHLIEHKAYLIEKAKREAEEERKRLAEERRQREQARIDRLLGQAAAFQTAETIRAFVSAAQAADSRLGKPAADCDLQAWAAWALAEADRIDPVLSGAFAQTDAVEADSDDH